MILGEKKVRNDINGNSGILSHVVDKNKDKYILQKVRKVKCSKIEVKLKIPAHTLRAVESVGKSFHLTVPVICSQAILGLLSKKDGFTSEPMPGGDRQDVWVRFSDQEVEQIKNSQYITSEGKDRPLGYSCARVLTLAMNGSFDMKYFHNKDNTPFKDRPQYSAWKLKPVPAWVAADFWGYYLAEYFKLVGREDSTFSGCSEKGTGWARRRIVKFIDQCTAGNVEAKEYLDWYFDFRRRQMADEFKHWTAPVVSFRDVFINDYFWKTYLLHKTGYNVYTGSKYESEGVAMQRRQDEHGMAYWNKKSSATGTKKKVIDQRAKLWVYVSSVRIKELKAKGIPYTAYYAEYNRPHGSDWKTFDRLVPQEIQEADFREWACKVLAELRGINL